MGNEVVIEWFIINVKKGGNLQLLRSDEIYIAEDNLTCYVSRLAKQSASSRHVEPLIIDQYMPGT